MEAEMREEVREDMGKVNQLVRLETYSLRWWKRNTNRRRLVLGGMLLKAQRRQLTI